MRVYCLLRWASVCLAGLVAAEDLLFYDGMTYNEYKQGTGVLNYTAHIASDSEWRSMTTADFAKYKAVIIPDPNCGKEDRIKFLKDTKAVWSPAITGNVILIGTDPTFHSSVRPGALDLIQGSVNFAASGNGTGLYFSLSCYYDSQTTSTVDVLSEFGTFTVRGRLSCYNDAHLVANSSALTTVDDGTLSNWSCSVHEVFSAYPTKGMNSFEPLAIAKGAKGEGEKAFADGTSGIPYIISRGATPVGCGNGRTDSEFGEECDDGDANGSLESLCSKSCKCLYGVISPGICQTNSTTTSTNGTTMSSTSYSGSAASSSATGLYTNSSTGVPANSTTFSGSSGLTTFVPTGSVTSTPFGTNFSSSATLSNATTSAETAFNSLPTATGSRTLNVSTSTAYSGNFSTGLSSTGATVESSLIVTGTGTDANPIPTPTTVFVNTTTIVPSGNFTSSELTTPTGIRSTITPGTSVVTVTIFPPGWPTGTAPLPSSSGNVTASVAINSTGTGQASRTLSSARAVNSTMLSWFIATTPQTGHATGTGTGTTVTSVFPETSQSSRRADNTTSSTTTTTSTSTTTISTSQSTGSQGASTFVSTISNGGVIVTVTVVPLSTATSGGQSANLTSIIPTSGANSTIATRTANGTQTSQGSPLSGNGTQTTGPSGTVSISRSISLIVSTISPGTSVTTITVYLPAPTGTPGSTRRTTASANGTSSTIASSSDTQGTTESIENPIETSTLVLTTTTSEANEESSSLFAITTEEITSETSSVAAGTETVTETSAFSSGSEVASSTGGTQSGEFTSTLETRPGYTSKSTRTRARPTYTASSNSTKIIGTAPPTETLSSVTIIISGSTVTSALPIGGTKTISAGSESVSASEFTSTFNSVTETSFAFSSNTRGSSETESLTTAESGTFVTFVTETLTTAVSAETTTSEYGTSTSVKSETRTTTEIGSLTTVVWETTLPFGSETVSASESESEGVSTSTIQLSFSTWSSEGPKETTTTTRAGRYSRVSSKPWPTKFSTRHSTYPTSRRSSRASKPISETSRATGIPTGYSDISLSELPTTASWDNTWTLKTSIIPITQTEDDCESETPWVTDYPSRTAESETTSFASETALPTSATSECGEYIGVEIIVITEVTEICPDEGTVTSTVTEEISTLTRSICHTSTEGYPCYACVIGTPTAGDKATVTVSSCASLAERERTMTVQLCSTCSTSTLVTSLPGYTPGSPCHGCVEYGSPPGLPPVSTLEIANSARQPAPTEPALADAPSPADGLTNANAACQGDECGKDLTSTETPVLRNPPTPTKAPNGFYTAGGSRVRRSGRFGGAGVVGGMVYALFAL